MGAIADVVPVYRVVPSEPDPEALEALSAGRVGTATFASGGTARRFVELVRRAGLDPDAVMSSLSTASVGPVTSAQLRSMGYAVDIEARESTMESLVEAIADHYSCPKPRE
jgi:uroporphyrinogen III methyltransferase/synthase